MRFLAANEYYLSLSTHSILLGAQSEGVWRGDWDTPGGPHGFNPGLLPVPALRGPRKLRALAEI